MPNEGGVGGAGKRNSTLAIQSVTLGVPLLDKKFPGYLDPKKLCLPCTWGFGCLRDRALQLF